MESTKESLQEEILEILYQKNLQTPTWTTCSGIAWLVKDIKVTERSVREVLDWLVKNDLVLCQADKYQISKREFIEMSKRKKNTGTGNEHSRERTGKCRCTYHVFPIRKTM